jgi:phage recombination protein Bet
MTVMTTERPTAVAQPQAGSLAIRADQTAWTDQQAAVLRQSGISDDVTAAELSSFLHLCQRTQLDPFSRQIYLIGRYDKRKQRTVFTPQTGIDGYRVIAQRVTGQTGGTYGYEDTLWCDSAGRWRDVWLSDDPPAAAKVTVIRNGQRFSAVARFSEYAETWPDGNLKAMWAKMPSGQIAKCCEALALRKAFPHDLAGVYTSEEMAQADNVAPEPQLQRQAPGPDAWQSAAPAAERQQATAQGAGGMDPDGPTGVGGYVAPLAPPQDAPQQPDADLSPQATQLLADAREATSPAASSRVRWVAERAGAPAGFLAWLDRIAAEKWSAAEDGNDPATGDGTEPPIYTGPAGGSGPALRSPAEAAEERLRIAASRARLTTVDDDFYAVYGLPIGDATAQQLNAFADRIEAAGGQQ